MSNDYFIILVSATLLAENLIIRHIHRKSLRPGCNLLEYTEYNNLLTKLKVKFILLIYTV